MCFFQLKNLPMFPIYKRLIRPFLADILTDKAFTSLEFRRRLGKSLDLKNPKTFNEKIQWIKLYDRNPLMTRYADKYEVKKIVENKVGAHILNELYGVFESADEIDFDMLPQLKFK